MSIPTTPPTVLLFPGQGSQFAGMGRELTHLPGAAELLREAEVIGSLPFLELATRGRTEELAPPAVAQVLVYCYSVAALRRWAESQDGPTVSAGHSVGEYAAMVSADMLDVEVGLRLVIERGRCMQECADEVGGTMGAVIGLASDVVAELCRTEPEQPVVLANDNSPRQVVVSGCSRGVRSVLDRARELGALRAKLLTVGGAYHSPLMERADRRMGELWRQTPLSPPRPGRQLVSSATGELVTGADEQQLTMQTHLTSPVRWCASMRSVLTLSPAAAVELGPSRVLRGLARELAPDLEFHDLLRLGRRASDRVAGAV